MLLNSIELPRSEEHDAPSSASARDSAPRRSSPPAGATNAVLPESLAITERAVATLRDYLQTAGLAHYRVFYNYCLDVDMDDLDELLEPLGEASAWEPVPGLVPGAGGVANVQIEHDGAARGQEPGCIHLRHHEVVLARWFWINAEEDQLVSLWLCAAPTFQHYARLRDAVRRQRHASAAVAWRIVNGRGPGERVPRASQQQCQDLMLSDGLRQRIEAEVVRFFGEEAAALYAAMRVPYRRGVLLHGPPGNGKTSLIRFIASRVPHVPGMILRPSAEFDTDALAAIVRRWTTQPPNILVIEDLDWLLKAVNVSSFLNLIDGIDSSATGGLLLLATTNHPEKLDPAINNRPGRFDVVIEVPPPDESLRLQFLERHLPEVAAETRRHVAAEAEGLAFAHLQEVVRLSGLLAISAGRAARSDDDVLAAFATVRESFDHAIRGFPARPEMPFGLAYLHRARRGRGERTADAPSEIG